MKNRILIVDDEGETIELLQPRLEVAGYEVVCALGGEEGLEKARQEKPDLVLLDVMMPKLNGYQVCRELKRDPKTKGMKIVMLTAKVQESDKYWGRECGADDYVTKPYEPKELLAAIKNLLLPVS